MYAPVNHFATPDFWFCYRQLPPEVRNLADKNFALIQADLVTRRFGCEKWVRFGRPGSAYITGRWRATGRKHWCGSGLGITASTTRL